MSVRRGTNHYIKGANFEREVMKLFDAAGYDVTRSAGSHGKWDLIALRPDGNCLIQCKLHGKIANEDWNILYHSAERNKALPIIATKERGPLELFLITGEKGGRGRMQEKPWEPFNLENQEQPVEFSEDY